MKLVRSSEDGRGVLAFASASVILLDLAIARVFLWADETYVYFLGKPVLWECGFRRAFHVPCPTCGLTRSIVLFLHGNFSSAWRVAPGGPALTLGLIALCGLLLSYARQSTNHSKQRQTFPQKTVFSCFALILMVWLCGWGVAVATALQQSS